MARTLLKDTCDLAAEILDGKHDADLQHIVQAAQARKRDMYRRGSRVRLVGTKNPKLEGKEGVVLKVNPTRVTVGVGEVTHPDWDTDRRYPAWSDGEYNVPPAMLEIL